jgi:hypothetical protein
MTCVFHHWLNLCFPVLLHGVFWFNPYRTHPMRLFLTHFKFTCPVPVPLQGRMGCKHPDLLLLTYLSIPICWSIIPNSMRILMLPPDRLPSSSFPYRLSVALLLRWTTVEGIPEELLLTHLIRFWPIRPKPFPLLLTGLCSDPYAVVFPSCSFKAIRWLCTTFWCEHPPHYC